MFTNNIYVHKLLQKYVRWIWSMELWSAQTHSKLYAIAQKNKIKMGTTLHTYQQTREHHYCSTERSFKQLNKENVCYSMNLRASSQFPYPAPSSQHLWVCPAFLGMDSLCQATHSLPTAQKSAHGIYQAVTRWETSIQCVFQLA